MIDLALVGTWNNGGAATIVILRTGEVFFASQTFPYTLQNGGVTLVRVPPSGPETFLRTGGSVLGLAGVWERTTTELDGIWSEELNLRGDGTYATHWTHDGAGDTDHFGWLTDNGTDFVMDERRGQLWTGPAQEMIMSQFWGPLLVGTYSVDQGGNAFTFHSDTGDIQHTRV